MQALQQFLPTISLSGESGFHQYNLAALGFGPSVLKKFGNRFPPGFSFITRATLTVHDQYATGAGTAARLELKITRRPSWVQPRAMS